jgi:ElaB/YqjD/DUF883 family membrane-anchored ribosome-binding protein
MTNVEKRPAGAKKVANQKEEADLSSDTRVKENVEDLGNTLGNTASREYERVQDVAKDVVQETGEAIRRNPLVAIATALGLGFLFGLFKRRS